MKIHERTLMAGLLSVALLLVMPGPATGAEQEDKPQSQPMHEGAISITGEGVAETMMVLGGELGRETVSGLSVGLFVLQAESPERLKPGASGPTHVFNLTFLDAAGKGLLKDVTGSLIIKGPEEEQRVGFQPFKSHHQAVARLEAEGAYRISVEFAAGEHKGRTKEFPFRFQRRMQEGHQH